VDIRNRSPSRRLQQDTRRSVRLQPGPSLSRPAFSRTRSRSVRIQPDATDDDTTNCCRFKALRYC